MEQVYANFINTTAISDAEKIQLLLRLLDSHVRTGHWVKTNARIHPESVTKQVVLDFEDTLEALLAVEVNL